MIDTGRLVLTDPVAIRYLEEDSTLTVLERRRELSGYEVYLVEQWACSRREPTIVITTFTGQVHHKTLASVLEIPRTEKEWSSRLKIYMKSVASHHARSQETKLGTLMVTNLSTFSSTLTVLPIPKGDLRGCRELFFVNENLKRMGCSGRAGLTLAQPNEATATKFRQLYRAARQHSVNETVIEMVQLCQIALTMFEKLPQEYCDGLLCDATEKGLADWWSEFGLQYYNVEPADGILGPSTVAALIGLFLGARNRLHAWGAPVSKDAYDIHALKRGIAQFQKSRNLPKTRRLDRGTLQKLHKHTAKAAASEGWAVPRAVKSTVAELGKGGEMVMGMVGKEKGGIADVETTDFDQFLKRLNGEQCKWLWRGKQPKSFPRGAAYAHVSESRPYHDDTGAYVWEDSSSDDDASKPRQSVEGVFDNSINRSKTSVQSADGDHVGRKNVLRAVTGRVNDAKAGLGRFRDTVRGHQPRLSRDSNPPEPERKIRKSAEILDQTQEEKPTIDTGPPPIRDGGASLDIARARANDVSRGQGEILSATQSAMNSDEEVNGEVDADNSDYAEESIERKESNKGQVHLPALRRARSVEATESRGAQSAARLDMSSRHLSLTTLPSVAQQYSIISQDGASEYATPEMALEAEQYKCVQLQHLHSLVSRLRDQYPDIASQSLQRLTDLGLQTQKVREDIAAAQRARMEKCQAGSKVAEMAIHEGRDLITARLQEVEALGAKLEYELGVLVSKIEDVEEAVADVERQVVELESRAHLLAEQSQDHSWNQWAESLGRRLRIL